MMRKTLGLLLWWPVLLTLLALPVNVPSGASRIYTLSALLLFAIAFTRGVWLRRRGEESEFGFVPRPAERSLPATISILGLLFFSSRALHGLAITVFYVAIALLADDVAFHAPRSGRYWKDLVFGAMGWFVVAVLAFVALALGVSSPVVPAATIVLASGVVALTDEPLFVRRDAILAQWARSRARQLGRVAPVVVAIVCMSVVGRVARAQAANAGIVRTLAGANVFHMDSASQLRPEKDEKRAYFIGNATVDVGASWMTILTDSVMVLLHGGKYEVRARPGEIVVRVIEGSARLYQGTDPMHKQLVVKPGEEGRMTTERRELTRPTDHDAPLKPCISITD